MIYDDGCLWDYLDVNFVAMPHAAKTGLWNVLKLKAWILLRLQVLWTNWALKKR
jgi:hypothetical protein